MSEQLSGQSSRQGKRGRPALYVLIASVGLMLVALVGLLTWQGASSPPDHAGESLAASSKSSGAGSSGASSANSAAVPAGNPAYPQPAARSANP